MAGGDLPDTDLRLRATLRLDPQDAPQVVGFTLPRSDDSFCCRCPSDRPHRDDCVRVPWVRFRLTTPTEDGLWCGDLIIYYETVPVHAQRLELPVGATSDGGPRAVPTYSLATSFEELRELSDRTASIFVTPGTPRLIVNGLSFVDNPFSLSINASDNAVRRLRRALYDAHFTVERAVAQYNRYDAAHRKTRAAFVEDLRVLAHEDTGSTARCSTTSARRPWAT